MCALQITHALLPTANPVDDRLHPITSRER